MTRTDLEPIAIHEAGHSYMAWRLGRPVGPVTVRPGLKWAGTSHYGAPQLTTRQHERLDLQAPYALWPHAVRHKIDTWAMVAAAGSEAEERLRRAPTTRRVGDTAAETAVQLAADNPPTRAEQRTLALAGDDTSNRTDEETLARLMRMVHPTDPATGAAWLRHITAQTRACLLAGAPAVLRLADALLEHKELSGRAVRAILETA